MGSAESVISFITAVLTISVVIVKIFILAYSFVLYSIIFDDCNHPASFCTSVLATLLLFSV